MNEHESKNTAWYYNKHVLCLSFCFPDNSRLNFNEVKFITLT